MVWVNSRPITAREEQGVVYQRLRGTRGGDTEVLGRFRAAGQAPESPESGGGADGWI